MLYYRNAYQNMEEQHVRDKKIEREGQGAEVRKADVSV